MKAKPIYAIWCTTKFGTGVQPVKANSKKEAEQKYKKRFPKSEIIEIELAYPDHKFYGKII